MLLMTSGFPLFCFLHLFIMRRVLNKRPLHLSFPIAYAYEHDNAPSVTMTPVELAAAQRFHSLVTERFVRKTLPTQVVDSLQRGAA